jgi:hypothetical protein
MEKQITVGEQCRQFLLNFDWSDTDLSKLLFVRLTQMQNDFDFLLIFLNFAQAFWLMAETERLKEFLAASSNFSGDFPGEFSLNIQLQHWKTFTNSENFKKIFG